MAYLIGLVLLCLTLGQTYCQVINLHHPESNQHLPRRPSPRPNLPSGNRPHHSRFTARPGNVIVHFDRSHEVQQVQYVLQDGRLATLFQRHRHHPANSQPPIQVPANVVQRRDEQAGSGPPQQSQKQSPQAGPPPANLELGPQDVANDETIDIVDSKLNSVSKLIGDHITFEGADGVIATIASDAIHTGSQIGEEKLKKLTTILLNKLKGKITQKLKELPALIEAKLREKSAINEKVMDHKGSKVISIEEGKTSVQIQPDMDSPQAGKYEAQPQPPTKQMELSPQKLTE